MKRATAAAFLYGRTKLTSCNGRERREEASEESRILKRGEELREGESDCWPVSESLYDGATLLVIFVVVVVVAVVASLLN